MNGFRQSGTVGLDVAAPLLALLIGYVSLVPYPFVSGFTMAGVPVLRLVPFVAGTILAAIALFRYVSDRRTGAAHDTLLSPILVLIAVELLGSIGSIEPVKSASKVVFYAISGVVFFFAARRLKNGEKLILWSALAVGCIVGIISTYEFFSGRVPIFQDEYIKNNPYFLYDVLKGRSFATLGHPVFLGAFFILVMPVGYFMLETERGVAKKAAAVICVAAMFLGLFFTFSRGAWLAVAVSTFIFYRERLKGVRMVAVLVAVVLTVGMLAGSGKVRDMLESRNPIAEYKRSSEKFHRLSAYEITGRVLTDAPVLGVGIGNYRVLYDKYRTEKGDTRQTYATPDNMYLVTLAESGLAGLGLFVYILHLASRKLRDGLAVADGIRRSSLLAGLAILTGLAIDSLFFDSLYVEPVRVIFWTFTGLFFREA